MITEGFNLTYMDEFVDKLLTEDRVCDIILPRLPKRETLEQTERLPPRKSKLMEAMQEKGSDDEERGRSRSRSPSRSVSRSRSPSYVGSDGDGDRYISKSPSRSRSRSNSPRPMDTT